MINIATTFHVLAVVIWVGGMFFAYMALRPVAARVLEPPHRLTLWVGVFGKFFPWVWASVLVVLVTGLWVLAQMFGSPQHSPHYVLTMYGIGLAMMAIFFYVYFMPYKQLRIAVREQAWPDGGLALARIRRAVGINTVLGFITIAIASSKLGV